MDKQFDYLDIDKFMQNFSTRIALSGLLIDFALINRLKAGLSSFKLQISRKSNNRRKTTAIVHDYLLNRGYKLIPHGSVYVAIRDCNNSYILSVMLIETSDTRISLNLVGDINEIEEIKQWVSDSFTTLGASVSVAEGISERGTIIWSNEYLTNDTTDLAKQSFYPWLSISIEDYFKAFMESDESILVLFGSPGTGKSTFLRSLIVSGNYNTYLAYNKKVIESELLLKEFYEEDAQILGYEDIDNHLKSRDDGNQLMSSLLNASEGVVKHKGKKIVLSTNLPSIDRIDPALLRMGRCFDILQFRELTPNEAQQVAEDAGISQKDWTRQSKWPLAQVLAKENIAQQTINRFAKKVGFL